MLLPTTAPTSTGAETWRCRLAAPVAGMFVDRARRRTVLIRGDLASAAAMLPLLLVHDAHQVWVIYGAAGSA